MAKIGRTLSYINTSPKPERNNGQTEQNQASGSSRPGNGGSSSIPGNLQDYLLKSIWDRVWEIKTDSQGNEYIFGKLPVVTQYGITMYADGGELNLPSIYAGIPFDNKTIWLNPETGKVEVIGGTGGGVADSVHWNNIEGKPTFALVATSGKYADLNGLPDLRVYATTEYLTAELKKYVTRNTEQTIGAHKDFLNGLSIGGLPITKSQDDVIYLDANLVVRGGITMYAEGEVDIPSIIDSLPIASNSVKGIASFDGTYFAVDSNGKVTLLAANVGLNEEELAAYLTEKKYATQSWVYSLGYASSSDLNALQTKVNDFLEGSDTDTIINKWKELESFLSGLSESDNLATILGTKANQSDLDDTNEIVATKWTQDDTKINNWDNAYKWGNHADVGYALKSYVDNEFKKYVTLADDQTIRGVKTFTNGLKIGTSTINQSQSDVVYIDANLVVRGGITMYSDNTVDVGTIFDALPIDGNTIYWDKGVLKANITDGVITNITSDMIVEALGFTPYNASNPNGYISGITSGMVVSALGYTPLQNHQTIYTLTIQKNGANVGTYTPDNAKKTINIVVPTKVSELDNDEEYATKSDLDSRIDALINGAPTAFDTLKEIADVLQGNVNSIGDIITTLGNKADKAIKISAGTGLSGGGTLEADRTLSLATSGVTAGTYKSVTVDKYGRVTSGTNPTTLTGYGITDAYTKTKVDELLGNYVTLATKQTITGEKNFTGGLKVNGSPIVYDATNKYWKLEGDLLVTGGVTMFASDSSFTPSTIMDAIATDGTNLKVVNGVLTFVGSIDGGEAGSVAWENVEGKPSFAAVATSGKYSDLSGTPTLLSSFTNDLGFIDSSALSGYLPLSGGTIEGWLTVKRDAKVPLYVYNSASGATESCMLFRVASTYLSYIGAKTTGYLYRYSIDLSKSYQIWDEGNFNPSDYLPLSGGKVSGMLTIGGRLLLENENAIQFTNSNNKELLLFPYSIFNGDLGYYNGSSWGKVWTSANDGEGSGLDADLLDGTHKSGLLTGASSSSATNLSITVGGTTKTITDLYAYKTTQLETPRTIWGQSFDGTGDVDGTITVTKGHIKLDNNYNIYCKDNSGSDRSVLYLNSHNNLVLGDGVAKGGTYIRGNAIAFQYSTSNATGMILTSTGNVLIGTTTESTCKLDVNGDIRTPIGLIVGSSSDSHILFQRPSKNYIWASAAGGSIQLGTKDYGDVSDTNASLSIYANNVRPGLRDNSVSLGISNIRWSNLYTMKATIDNIPIYKSQDDVLYIEGNLAVKGGITMYATNAIDVPSIIDALPIASASAKGIASFNPNDFSVVDGYVSFIGKGGVDESVLADYAKKTDLSKYLPLSGGKVTGQIEYNFDWGGNIPAAGAIPSYTNATDFTTKKSFMGNGRNTNNDRWYNIISVRADNGSPNFGMYITSSMTDYQGNLTWNKQEGYDGNWQGERVILDSVNWSDYVSVGSGNISGNKLTIDGEGYRGAYPALRLHIPNVTYVQFLLTESGMVELRYGDSGQSGGLQNLSLYTLYTENGLHFRGGEDFDYHGNIYIPNADGSWSWNVFNSNNSNVMSVYTNGNVLVAGGITMYSDIRKKTKLQDVELSLKQIAEAPLIEHYYNSDEKKTTHVGSIAQYWASMNDWFCKLDNDGYYTMEIQNAALASAISIARELVKYESKTDRKIRLLKQRVKELEDKIEKLENN